MAVLHAALAWIAAASTIAVLAIALPTAAGWLRTYRALDGALLAQAGANALAVAVGGALLATAGPPDDGLHLLYGAVTLGLPIGVRLAAQGRPARTIGRWVTVAALAALGATFRSFTTGS